MTNEALTVQAKHSATNGVNRESSSARQNARRDEERTTKRKTATTVPIVYFYLNLFRCQFYQWNDSVRVIFIRRDLRRRRQSLGVSRHALPFLQHLYWPFRSFADGVRIVVLNLYRTVSTLVQRVSVNGKNSANFVGLTGQVYAVVGPLSMGKCQLGQHRARVGLAVDIASGYVVLQSFQAKVSDVFDGSIATGTGVCQSCVRWQSCIAYGRRPAMRMRAAPQPYAVSW